MLTLKNSFTEHKSRKRFLSYYAHKHIIVNFSFIFKSLIVWMITKKNIFMEVNGSRIQVIIFEKKLNAEI